MTDTPANPPPTVRQANGRFGKGNPGRPLGSRNRLPPKRIMEILAKFSADKEALLNRYHATLDAEGRRPRRKS